MVIHPLFSVIIGLDFKTKKNRLLPRFFLPAIHKPDSVPSRSFKRNATIICLGPRLLSGSCGTSRYKRDTALHPVRILPFHLRFFVPMAELGHLRWDWGLSGPFEPKRHCSHLYSRERPPLADTFFNCPCGRVGVRTFLPSCWKSNRLDCRRLPLYHFRYLDATRFTFFLLSIAWPPIRTQSSDLFRRRRTHIQTSRRAASNLFNATMYAAVRKVVPKSILSLFTAPKASSIMRVSF